jgi:1,2-diacylglycerol 3-alpha-glucosyltransferase
VASLLADRQRLSFLSKNSRAFAETYFEEKIAEKVLRLYRRVIVLGKSKNG